MGKHVFGPVPSRRLGISLGVDLVQAKTCNFDCVFCECGGTPSWTKERGVFIPFEEVIQEIDEALQDLQPDYITFSGSGEPTLSSDLGKVIDYIRERYDVKIAVITNSALLYQEEVREALNKADLIMPSLHTLRQESFERIVRPFSGYKIETLLEGLSKLSANFQGMIDLELFLLEGVNTSWEELEEYAKFIKTLSYHKLQLNSLDRAGAETWVKALSQERLEEIKIFLQEKGVKSVEIIGKFSSSQKLEADTERLDAMKARRKYSQEEIKSLYK